jgi:diaminopimelate epimerase
MKRTFVKMQGLGNDFAVFDARKEPLSVPLKRIAELGNRHRGIGFDQMIVIEAAKSPDTDCFMRIYNADGSEVSACGNATRCLAILLSKELKKETVKIETKAGVLEAAIVADVVRVDMGLVKIQWQEIPLSIENNTNFVDFSEGLLTNPTSVNVGNPHAVFFVEDVDAVPLAEVGPRVETAALFPEKTNVEIVQVLSQTSLRMRVWERGAGITQACGTGACAAAVAAARRNLTGRKVQVILDGGTLDIEWRESDNHVLMTGLAAEVYRGEVEI